MIFFFLIFGLKRRGVVCNFMVNEDVFDRKKRGRGVLKCYWIKFEKVCILVFYFKSEFWVFLFFSWYFLLLWWYVCVLGWRRVYFKDIILWWCVWLFWWIWWVYLWWIFYFCMILYLYIISVNKYVVNCIV